jgi:formylglycine-generating enzyme required for sulfatase activity
MNKIALIICTCFIGSLMGNNIQVNNSSLINQNTTAGPNNAANHTFVKFNISWENSWRNDLPGDGNEIPNNWDAAWVFVKYRSRTTTGGDGLWRHATLNTSGHTAPAGSMITTTPDGKGVFIYRSENGTGTFSLNDVLLRWNYAQDLETATPGDFIEDNDFVDIRIFAIEMVYVNEGEFYVGSGGTGGAESNAFTRGGNTSGATIPYLITSTPPVIVGNNAASNPEYLSARTSQHDVGNSTDTVHLGSAFPTGYHAFYMMKHELSQAMYVSFLNTLTFQQQDWNCNGSPAAPAGTYAYNDIRHKIKIVTPGVAGVSPAVYDTDHLDLPYNISRWTDLAAFFDWSALRPHTELEYEKACRGPANPVPNEFPWGNNQITNQPYSFANLGQPNEVVSNNYALNAGNVAYGPTMPEIVAPVRVGIFALENSNKMQAGASYYGILDLGGNVQERAIYVGNAVGRAFSGLHGDGSITPEGFHNVLNWPANNGLGIGWRGGFYNNQNANASYTSNRGLQLISNNTRTNFSGGRGVRSAP